MQGPIGSRGKNGDTGPSGLPGPTGVTGPIGTKVNTSLSLIFVYWRFKANRFLTTFSREFLVLLVLQEKKEKPAVRYCSSLE